MNAWIETPATVVVRANPVCWLLMMDIKRYTSLSRQLDTDALSLTIATWLWQCRDTVESAGGVVDKFLGDAIFACWKNTAEAPALATRAVHELIEFQRRRDPDFRIVLHRASVTLEGGDGGPITSPDPRSSIRSGSRRSAPDWAPIPSSARRRRPPCLPRGRASPWAAIRSMVSPAPTRCSG